MQSHPMVTPPSRPDRSRAGFTLIELMIASALMLVIAAGVFGYYMTASKTFESQTSERDMQQAARIAVDELGRNLMQAGYGVDRPGKYNSAGWQASMVHAGAHALAFNSDIDPALGPIDDSQTLTFPTGETYTGQGDSDTTDGAET